MAGRHTSRTAAARPPRRSCCRPCHQSPATRPSTSAPHIRPTRASRCRRTPRWQRALAHWPRARQ
eukprot:3142206-Prymnesium_polylepis.2